MKRIDYHIHTCLSGDNTQTPEALADRVIELGLDEICITEHIDFNPGDTCYGFFNWNEHLKHKDYMESRGIRCKLGGEISYQPEHIEQIKKIISSCDFDYIMGSGHYVDNQVIFHHDEYFEGRTEKETYTRYFETELESIKTGYFDSLAHFDLVKRWGARFYGPFNPAPYMDIIDECLKEVIERGMAIELNSAGTRQDPKDYYPHKDILKRYKELGGELITFGSDCHRPDRLALRIDEAYDYLRSLGYKTLCTYTKRQPELFDI